MISVPGYRIGIAVGVLLILIILTLRILLPDVFTTLASPLWNVGTMLTRVVSPEEDGATIEALQEENRTLTNENEALRARLRDVGADAGIPSETGVLAGVLSRPPLSPYDVLVVDVGREQEVFAGALVYGEGVPIGTVAEAGERSARVLLYSAPGRESEGWIGEERLPVTLRGSGAGIFEADVPRDMGVVAGALVYLPGPGALPIGSVVRVEDHPSAPRVTLHIRPAVNPFGLTWVRIKEVSL